MPNTVMLALPSGVLGAVATTSDEGAPGRAGFGEKVQVAPASRPLHDRLTVELKLPMAPIDTL